MSFVRTTQPFASSARTVAKQNTRQTAAHGAVVGTVQASVPHRLAGGLGRVSGAALLQRGPTPPAPARARGAVRAVSQARPESASQRVYTAVRALQPVLAQNPAEPVRSLAKSLAPVLEEYREHEDLLAGGQGRRVALEVGFKAVAALEVILMILQSLEEACPRLPVRPVRLALVQRREELRSLNWRSRLELCMRAPSATKE